MKRVIVFVLLLLIPLVSASQDVSDYLAEEIYQECGGKQMYVSDYLIEKDSSITHVFGQEVTKDKINQILGVIIKNEPYDLANSSELKEANGYHLMGCGTSWLDVSFNIYYWKGERVDVFDYNYNKIVKEVDNRFEEISESYSYENLMEKCIKEKCSGELEENWIKGNWLFLVVNIILSLFISILIISLSWKLYISKNIKALSRG